MNDELKKGMSDHDILLILHTKMDRLEVDVKELKDNLVSRVSVLEQTKTDKVDAAILSKRVDDMEKNQTRILTWGTVIGGILAVALTVTTIYSNIKH